MDQLVGQFLQSGAGADILKQLQGQGLDANQAKSAVTATADGAMQQLQQGSGGGLAGLAGNLLGGQAGGMNLASFAGPISQFVAAKTGLSPAIANTVVSLVLPKLSELIAGQAAKPAAQAGGLGSMLGGLLK